MRRIYLLFLGYLSAVLLLSACGTSTPKSESVTTSDIQENDAQDGTEIANKEAADGYDVLGGHQWEVGGLFYKNQVVDIKDNDMLTDLYDSIYLSFGEDGSFLYLDVFPKEGTYEPYAGDGKYNYYLLKTVRNLKYDTDKGEFVDNESGSKKTYIIALLDDNTFEYVEFDKVTGRAKANEDPLIFVKSDAESPFVQNNKIKLSKNGNNKNVTDGYSSSKSDKGQQPAKSASSYQSILDEYTEKMKAAVPNLVREYKSEASGISNIERLAEISNNKVSELAEICNEGVGKMAELMYSRGDSYDTYESWAGKLMDNYNDIAQEIMDAYLDSAT